MGRYHRSKKEAPWSARGGLSCAVPAVCLVLALLAASVGPAAAQEPAGTQLALRYSSGADATALISPAKALDGGKSFYFRAASGSLSVAGSPVAFAVSWHEGQRAFYAGMDTDGDGQVAGKEFVKLNQTMSGTYKVQAGGQTHVVRVSNVNPAVRTDGKGGIVYVRGAYTVCGYYQGTYQGATIRLFDENADGKITQDGSDSIVAGRAEAAVPLRTIHQIGNYHCTLSVAEDGSSVTVTPLADPGLGVVLTTFRRGLKVLSMIDEEGRSYDIATSGRTGVPAGRYKLHYGVLTDGKAVAVIKPTDKCPVYEIQAGKINKLRIGAPLWVSFSATVQAGNVKVSPVVNIYGAGYEEYRFDMSGGTGRPHVLMVQGGAVLQDAPMDYG